MKLYTHLDRFEDEMRARNLLDGKISEKDLSSFDMMHYYGVESVKEAAISLDLDKRQRILGFVSEIWAPELDISIPSWKHMSKFHTIFPT